MNRSSKTLLAASCATLLAGGLIGASPAAAGGRHHHHPAPQTPAARTIAEGLFTPLSLAIDQRGRALVAQNFAGELLRITPDGQRSTIATAPTPGDELGAVSTRGRTTYYATTSGMGSPAPTAKLYAQRAGGAGRQIADLRAFEATRNPDRGTTYGFRDLPQSCSAQFPADNPASYTGLVDSHPYATSVARDKVYVADAAANAILSVRTGKRRMATPKVVAVLPAIPSIATAEVVADQGLPPCATGHTYWFEPVPTDVEQGRDGWLYVTSLPGGPEDASLGARGAVFKVNPHSGAVRRVAGGFVGAVNLALGPDGTIAVAELFGGDDGSGQVTLVKPGSNRRTVLPLPAPGAVEWVSSRWSSKLYVTTDAFGPAGPAPTGKLQVLDMAGSRHRH
ncbi:ScyD/ScyE family protein [Aeromicrobium wangtongii]|uniref:ScyD/ScyE family protein n=1 Tax=Aeromicrobium wangtongii TaxID=2969247 RepID=A0ABY5M7R8_9ACTN|nr:ScyD/ScyE family protein [Aeromicrobium wangtongii]MCD9199529.1 ScyD/ScyE family protein [Aeromicrobium wangtongii]UUP13882.1 ScyD/ScyE family protein [Aeromicrobium wangtongii]